jgi:hypothetical protein
MAVDYYDENSRFHTIRKAMGQMKAAVANRSS